MDTEIKRLYDAANGLHTQAKAILDEYKGRDMPADKAQEVDTLLDQVEAKSAEAKRLERAAGMEDTFNKPASHLPMGGGEGKGAGPLSEETKSALRMAGYKNAAIEERFATEQQAKQAMANAMYWKHGLEGVDRKALATSPAGAGGYLVTDTQYSELIAAADPVSAMRRISRVLPTVPSGSVIIPSQENDLSDATWTTEIKTGSEDTVKPFGGRVLTPKPLAKRIKISNTELRAGRLIDVEGWVLTRMGARFGIPQEYAFINGTGVNAPLGLLNASGIPAYTTAASTTLAADDIINWCYSLPSGYAGQARILANRSFIRKTRLLKDKNDQYLWQPGLSVGMPGRILDWAYELSDQYPTGLSSDTYVANSLIATIGNFGYYWIVDSLMLSIKRLDELYAETDQTGYIGRIETDGMPMLAEAFYHLKVKA